MIELGSDKNCELNGLQNLFNYIRITKRHHIFYATRSYAALQAADLDWIVGLGYS